DRAQGAVPLLGRPARLGATFADSSPRLGDLLLRWGLGSVTMRPAASPRTRPQGRARRTRSSIGSKLDQDAFAVSSLLHSPGKREALSELSNAITSGAARRSDQSLTQTSRAAPA